MMNLGLVDIAKGTPVAILARNTGHFLGAFCSGEKSEDLTLKIMNVNEIYPHVCWVPGASPVVKRLEEKLAKLDVNNPKIRKMIWKLDHRS